MVTPPPEELGGYLLVEELERDHVASIWTAVRSGAEEPEAVLLERLESNAEGAAARVLSEAAAARKTRHELLLEVLGSGRADGSTYVVLARPRGVPLDELLAAALDEGELLSTRVVARIALDLVEALDALHHTGVVHGDVTLKSLHVDRDGAALLAPTCLGVAAARVTPDGRCDRLGYKAPEQLDRPEAEPGRAVDVFAAGVVVWEALTGRWLFGGGEAAETIDAVRTAVVSRLDRVCAHVTPALADVVEKALRRDVEARYEDVRSLGAALERSVGDAVAGRERVAELFDRLVGERHARREAWLSRVLEGRSPSGDQPAEAPFALERRPQESPLPLVQPTVNLERWAREGKEKHESAPPEPPDDLVEPTPAPAPSRLRRWSARIAALVVLGAVLWLLWLEAQVLLGR